MTRFINSRLKVRIISVQMKKIDHFQISEFGMQVKWKSRIDFMRAQEICGQIGLLLRMTGLPHFVRWTSLGFIVDQSIFFASQNDTFFFFYSFKISFWLVEKKKASCLRQDALINVPTTGFEPAHLLAPPPQDGVSTNFTTWAADYPI